MMKSLLFLILFLIAPLAFAQGVFEGSGEVNDPNCVGDGCGFVPADQASQGNGQNYEYGNATTDADSLASNDSTQTKDSAKVATANIDEEDETPHFVENAAEYRARKEGFSRGVQFGVRAMGGISKNFGKQSSDWNIGPEFGGGLMARLPLGRSFGVATELNFSYRRYSYDGKSDYGKNEASIKEVLFEIPMMGQYVFDEDGFFINLGANLGLKMSGDSEFNQTIDVDGKHDKDKRSNTVPTVGVEIGGLLGVGYVVNRWLSVDLRAVQNFTNLLDLDLIAESALMHSKLYTMHVTLGVTFLL
jgi:hypothetical protein